MPCLRLGPGKESLQNEADKSILTSKFVLVLVAKSTQQKPKAKTIFKNYMLRNKLVEPVLCMVCTVLTDF